MRQFSSTGTINRKWHRYMPGDYREPDNVCQLRLDMQEFFLSEPDDMGLCTTDSFMVRTTVGERLPILCGENKGQHLYVDMGRGSGNPVVLSVVSNGDKMSRRWKIKISMIECGSLNMAPAGCPSTSGIPAT
ncbi:hypothetical protein CEXT_797521, partial [Caerostris extrusa]